VIPIVPFLNFIFIFFGSGVVYRDGRQRSFAEFNAGERDETRIRHGGHVSRHHGGPRANRAAAERSDQ
jgi:hypothetical protein